MNVKGTILLVDDDLSLADSVKEVLESRGYAVRHLGDGEAALPAVDQGAYDLVLTDFRMPGLGGMQLLERLKVAHPKLPVIMMTAFSSTDRAIEATKKGAFDYLIKPFEMPDLLDVVQKAITSSRLSAKPVSLEQTGQSGQDVIVGQGRAMQSVFKEIGRLAEKSIPVLIRGETGTGKELIARAIYQHSNRRHQPFVAVNCAAIPDSLLESELFGHEKGAFTHAVAQRIGRFEQASGGTLFLDEIGDLPPQTQVKLLRVLQEKTISRIGGKSDIPVDVRIISATHRDVESMIRENTFREDLYYRLNGASITLPPVRDRPEDIPLLADHFLARYSQEFEMPKPQFHPEAVRRLKEHSWPGNVRQLENVVRKALVDSRGFTISADHIERCLRESERSLELTADRSVAASVAELVRRRLQAAMEGNGSNVAGTLQEDLERELYQQAVALADGNQSTIAKWLGVSRITVREKLDKYNLFPRRQSSEPN